MLCWFPVSSCKCGTKVMILHVLFLLCYLMHTRHPGVLSKRREVGA